MPEVTFYTHVADLDGFACKLVARVLKEGCRLLVWTEDGGMLDGLDKRLWQHTPESFIPHEIWAADTPFPEDCPAVLATGGSLPEVGGGVVVLNLSGQFWSRAEHAPQRVLEVAGNSLEALDEARQRFRAYRSDGWEIRHHNMEGKA